jgi:DnaJ-domain-containing protein 1
MAFQDYYRILGISRTATSAQIRKAYRRLALRYHPDRNPDDPNAEEQFKKITQIYETIADPKRRAEYDRMRNAFERGASDKATSDPAYRARSRASQTRSPRRKATGPRRPGRQPVNPLGFEQKLEDNPLDLRDLRVGGAAGAVLAAVYSFYPPQSGLFFLWAVAIAFPWFGERVGFYLGSQIARLFRFEFVENASGMKIPFGMGLLISISGGWFGACAWGFGSSIFSVMIPPGQLLIGAIAAGLASPVGAAFGRAFTSVVERRGAKLFGVAVGTFIGLILGAVVGGFLSLFRLRSFGDENFSQIFFSAVVGGALGAALGSGVGSLRKPTLRK